MPGAPTLIVFLGGFGSSEPERLVDNARIAASLDAIEAFQKVCGGLGEPAPPAFLITNDPTLKCDIDTPRDLCVLALTGVCGPRLQAYVRSLDLDVSRYRAVLPLFVDQTKRLLVAGRVGTHSWSYLERETACRVRLFAEERGME